MCSYQCWSLERFTLTLVRDSISGASVSALWRWGCHRYLGSMHAKWAIGLMRSRHSGIFPPVSTQINHGSALNRVPDEIFTHEYPQQETLDITSWQAYK